MAHFEFIDKYKECGLSLPVRETQFSAGYDLAAAEDIVIPSYHKLTRDLISLAAIQNVQPAPLLLKDVAELTSAASARPTLVPTGLACEMDSNTYLAIVPRSSIPLKHWLVIANSPATIDADYYPRHVYIPVYNLSPFDIQIKKGDKLAQAIILPYLTTSDDAASGLRTGGFGSTTA